MGEKDYYKILGINEDASQDEIKKAYRKLAHQYHPDKGGDEAKFKEINEAYQILSNKEKRAQYDAFRKRGAGFGNFSDFSNFWQNNGQGFRGQWADFSSFSDFSNIEDILNEFFSGFGFGRKQPEVRQGSDIQVEIEISLKDAFFGIEKEIAYKRYKVCPKCNGAGSVGSQEFITCPVCNGTGKVKEIKSTFFGAFSKVKTCSNCQGTGKVPKNPCPICYGSGRVLEKDKIKIKIEKGVADSQILKISEKGNAGYRGATPGDLYVIIHIVPDKEFKRRENDLFIVKEINVIKAMLGGDIELTNIDGEIIKVKIPQGVSEGDIIKIKNKGFPKFASQKRGDLFIKIKLIVPKKINRKTRKLLEEAEKEL